MTTADFLNGNPIGQQVREKLGVILAQDLASELEGKVIVDKFELDAFAAKLYHADASLYASFCEAFPDANAGAIVGANPT